MTFDGTGNKTRSLFSLGSSGFLGTLVFGLFWFFLAGFLGPTDYGEVSYYFAVATIAVSISSLSLQTSMTVLTAKEIPLKNTLYLLGVFSSAVASLIVFFIFFKFEISLFVIGATFFGLVISEILGRKLYGKFALYNLLQKLFAIALALSLYQIFDLLGIILGFALSYFIFVKDFSIIFKTRKFNFSQLKSKMKFILTNYVSESTYSLLWWSDRFILLPYFGFELLGNYQLSMQALLILLVIPFISFQYLLPQDSAGKKNPKLKILVILSSVIISIFVFFFGPDVIEIFLPQFTSAIAMIQIMSIALVPLSINLIYTSYYLGKEKSKYLAIGHSIQLTIHLLAIFILSEVFGINTIAYAILFASISESIYFVAISKIKKI